MEPIPGDVASAILQTIGLGLEPATAAAAHAIDASTWAAALAASPELARGVAEAAARAEVRAVVEATKSARSGDKRAAAWLRGRAPIARTPEGLSASDEDEPEDAIKRMLANLRAGDFFGIAARAAGLDEGLALSWFRRGRDPESEHRAFYLACAGAEAEAEHAAINALAGDTEPQHARTLRWWLERRHPERWGSKVRHVVDEQLGEAIDRIEALESELGVDVVERVLAAIAGEEGREPSRPTASSAKRAH